MGDFFPEFIHRDLNPSKKEWNSLKRPIIWITREATEFTEHIASISSVSIDYQFI